MTLSIVTTCGGRLDHLRQTLPVMLEAAQGAQADVEVIVVDFGPTAGLEAFTAPFRAVKRVCVASSTWNFGTARNAGLAVARGAVFINVDCDGFIDAESLDAVAAWFEKQGANSYMRSTETRGVHGRCAFFTDELRALGGFHEEGIDGAVHVMAADIADIYARAEARGMNSARWPKRFEVIEHDIDEAAALRGGRAIRHAMQERAQQDG